VCSVLSLIVQDSVSAPDLQAVVERLFLMCDMLTAGRCKRLDRTSH